MKDAISTKQGFFSGSCKKYLAPAGSFLLGSALTAGILFFSGNLNLPQDTDDSEANKKAKVQQAVKKHKIAHKLSSGPLLYESWIDYDSKCKAALICVHGLGLNSSSYEEFGRKMSRDGYPCYAVDVRGFGRWLSRSKKLEFKESISDIKTLADLIAEKHQNCPIVIVGESMGGAIAIQTAAAYPGRFAGVVSVAPSDERYRGGKIDLKVGLKFLLGPKKQVDWGDSILSMATSDDKLQKEWKRDPRIRLKLSPSDLIKFQDFMNETDDAAEKLAELPVLMLHGDKDRLIKETGTLDLYDELKTQKKDLFILGENEHLLFEEGHLNKRSTRLLSNWLDENIAAPRPAEKTVTAVAQAGE